MHQTISTQLESRPQGQEGPKGWCIQHLEYRIGESHMAVFKRHGEAHQRRASLFVQLSGPSLERRYLTCCVRLSSEKEPNRFVDLVEALHRSHTLQHLKVSEGFSPDRLSAVLIARCSTLFQETT